MEVLVGTVRVLGFQMYFTKAYSGYLRFFDFPTRALLAALFFIHASMAVDSKELNRDQQGSNTPILKILPSRVLNESNLFVRLSVPNHLLAETLDSVFDEYRELSGVQKCPMKNFSQECNFSYDISFKRNGRTSISVDSDRISLAIPVRLEGEISIRTFSFATASTYFLFGSSSKHHHGPVTGAFEAIVSLQPKLTREWCFKLEPNISIDWKQKPKIASSSNLNYLIRSFRPIDKQIEDRLSEVISKEKLDEIRPKLCALARNAVDRIWRTHSIPIDLGDRNVYVNIDPTFLRYSGPKLANNGVDLGLHVKARTYISLSKIINPKQQLPALRATGRAQSNLYLEVPALIPLAELKSAANETIRHTKFNPALPIPGLTAEIHQVEPEVENERIKFKVDYSLNAWWLPARLWGKVDISGVPVVSPSNHLIMMSKVKAQTRLNSTVLDWLFSWALKKASNTTRIKIANVAKIDARPNLERSIRRLRSQLTKLDSISGIQANVSDLAYSLDRVEISKDGVGVFAKASGRIKTTMERIPPPVLSWIRTLKHTPFMKPYQVVNLKKGKFLSIRADTYKNSKRIGTIPALSKGVKVYDCKVGTKKKEYKWCEVDFEGKRGWVHQYYIAPE